MSDPSRGCQPKTFTEADLATEIKRALAEAKDLPALQLQAEHIARRIKPYLRELQSKTIKDKCDDGCVIRKAVKEFTSVTNLEGQ